MKKTIRLQQDQVWKKGDECLRIVHLERLVVEFKSTNTLTPDKWNRHTVTKKIFCRLIKHATLLPPSKPQVAPTTEPIAQ